MMKRRLRGRSVVITGGSSGLGRRFAELAVDAGANVHLLARNEQKLLDAVAELNERDPDGTIGCTSTDINDEDALETTFAEIGRVDVLVCGAGILTEGRFDEQDPEVWRRMLETNFFGNVNSVRAALPALKASGGQIAVVASMAGLLGVYGYTAYSASKHALIGFADSLRYELDGDGVSVNLICPGEFDSPMVDELDTHRSAANRAHVQTIPKSGVDVIAKAVLKAVESDRPMTVPGLTPSLAARLSTIFPGTTRRIGRRAIRRARRS